MSFRGHGYWARDPNIELWLNLLARKVREMPSHEPWLKELGDHWHIQSGVGFVGCIDAGLDKFLTQNLRIEQVITLGESVLEDLQQRGAVLARDELNALQIGGEGSAYLDDVPTEIIFRQGDAFLALIQGDIITTSQTAPPNGPVFADSRWVSSGNDSSTKDDSR